VNYVDKTNIPGEDEFLFVPYSVFKVTRVDWQEKPLWTKPHRVYLEAAVDNALHPEENP